MNLSFEESAAKSLIQSDKVNVGKDPVAYALVGIGWALLRLTDVMRK